MAGKSNSEVRDRGFLTEDDRRYLRGEKEDPPEGSARRQKHLNIRNRLENALHDFQIVEQGFPDKDLQQVFEPAYQWGRERRRLNEEGKFNATPESPELVHSLIAFFSFFGYSMALGRVGEINTLRDLIVMEGFERGLRRFMWQHSRDYIDYNASFEIEIAEREVRQDYLISIDRSIPEKPDEAAQQILNLHHQNLIPTDFAQKLWDHYVGHR